LVTLVQTRSPVHTLPVTLPALQKVSSEQLVFSGQNWHSPPASQLPVCPQVLWGSVSQLSCGSVPSLAAPHVPSSTPLCLSAARQAEQSSVQASSQQTPSTQKPVDEVLGGSHSRDSVQLCPLPLRAPQLPPELQKLPAVQSSSSEQLPDAGQLPVEPSQRYAPQPVPVTASSNTVHSPSVLAPSDCLHTSHPPLHAASQHIPSEQCPVVQTRQPATSQSAPALSSQKSPSCFRG
jgi:hypothetical protein